METLFLIYDELFEDQVRAIIEQGMVIPRYTRIDSVIGARSVVQEFETGYRADRHNRMIVAVAESETIYLIVEQLRALRHREGHGLRAFVVPVREVI